MDSPQEAHKPETKLHFLDYWRIIRIRKMVILAVFLLVVITTTVVTFYLPEAYSSRVRISIEKDNSDIEGLKSVQSFNSYDPFYLQTEFEKIQSQSILDPVITNRLDLVSRWSKKYTPDGTLRIEEARLILKNMISVKQFRNTSLIEIWVYDSDKNEAAEIANEIADVYRKSRLFARSRAKEGGIKTFNEKLVEKDKEISKKEKEVNDLRETNNIPDIGDPNSSMGSLVLNTETLRQLEKARVEADTDYINFFSMLTNIQRLNRIELRKSLTTTYPDQQLSTLLESFDIAESKLAGLKQDYGDEHQAVRAAQAMYKKTDEQVNEKISGILLGLETKVNSYKARLDELTAKVQHARTNDINLAATYRPYFNAKSELEALRRIRELIKIRLEQENIELTLPTLNIVEVVDKAEPGLKPVRPNKPLNIGLGIFVGLILGIGLAFFIEYLDTSVKTIDDVERALQAPVLGVIPQNVGSLLDEGLDSPHAEAYRVLRTNILFSRKDDTWNTLSVVSGGAGEGKSTTLFNLATIFAQNGSRVLVVDSDLRRPSIHKILRVANTIGLTNYLLKQNTLEEVIQTTGLNTLDFLPSGKLPSSSMGILSSVQMKSLIVELKRRYDFVFFDSPPIMGVSDASILASEVDMVLQVIQYRRYPQIMTIRAKQMIQNVGGNLVGIVLNNINMSSDENYYYYSGYYYDYYSKHTDDSDEDNGAPKKAGKETARVDLKKY